MPQRYWIKPIDAASYAGPLVCDLHGCVRSVDKNYDRTAFYRTVSRSLKRNDCSY